MPRCGWMPAHQRLESDDLAAGVPLRLIFQIQLAVCDGRLQIVLQRAAVAQLLIHRGGEEAYRAAAFVLCTIERRVGIGEQRPRIVAVARIDRDPDAQIKLEGVAVDLDIPVQRAAQPVRRAAPRSMAAGPAR